MDLEDLAVARSDEAWQRGLVKAPRRETGVPTVRAITCFGPAVFVAPKSRSSIQQYRYFWPSLGANRIAPLTLLGGVDDARL
jgi:hypothetical protein